MDEISINQSAVKPWYKKTWFIGLSVFIVLWFGVPLVFNLFFPRNLPIDDSQNSVASRQSIASEVWTKDDPMLGVSEAPIAIVEFGDFQCPFCKDSEPVISQLLAKYPEAIKLQFRDSPITSLHPEALAAAEAANCAGQQGKYWPYHQVLYTKQDSLNLTTYQSIATDLGINLDQFNRCLSGHLTLAEIKEDYETGQKLGVTGTPTFFVNGRLLAGHIPLELWDKIIPLVLKEDLNK